MWILRDYTLPQQNGNYGSEMSKERVIKTFKVIKFDTGLVLIWLRRSAMVVCNENVLRCFKCNMIDIIQKYYD